MSREWQKDKGKNKWNVKIVIKNMMVLMVLEDFVQNIVDAVILQNRLNIDVLKNLILDHHMVHGSVLNVN